MSLRPSSRPALALLSALSLTAALGAGCASSSQATQPMPETSQTGQTAQTPAGEGRLSDAQIAAIVVTANQIDIENGQLADVKGQNPEVRRFAQRMMEDHRAVNQSATDLVSRLGVTPEESPTSRTLKTSADQTREQLKRKRAAEFDRAYVDNEVAYHQAVLQMLDSTLIPSATNGELRSLLQSVRPSFVAHLEHAQTIQKSLGGQGGSGHSGH
jgi:putative membrane protein